MVLSGIYYKWGWAYGGNSGSSWTAQMNFPPSSMVAKTSLSMASGEGLCVVGITQYRVRPDPKGAEQEVNFNWDPNIGYPPSVSESHTTSVTAKLSVGAHQQGVAMLTIYFFS
jgi:hypothetical protein